MKNKKKLISTILISVGVVLLAAGAVAALLVGTYMKKNKADVAWYQEEGKEFVITTAEELRGIAKLSEEHNFEGQTVKLGADIVLNEGTYEEWKTDFLKSVWNPITGFAGTFDGQGHTISGLYCVANGFTVVGKDVLWNPAGMFNDSTDAAVIKNFKITNSYYSSSNKGGLGSVIGRGNGTIDSVYSDAYLVASASVNGGLVGEVKEGGSLTMTNCQFDGKLLLRGSNGVYSGGMIGYVKTTKGSVSIKHCLFSGIVESEQKSGTLDVGGFIGFTIGKSKIEMKDCLSAGKIKTVWTRNAGSVIGSHTGTLLKAENVYADLGCFNATVGLISGSASSYPLEFVSEWLEGENAYKWTELDFEKYWTVVEGEAPALRSFAEKEVPEKSVDKAYDTDWYNNKEKTYTISTLEEFYGFYVLSAQNNFNGKTIKMGADLTVNTGTVDKWMEEAPSVPWYPIKKFAGTFDGDGHTISGIYLKTAQRNAGLFSETNSTAHIQNFRLTNSYFECEGDGIAMMGSIVGLFDGEMNTVYSDAVVVVDALIAGGLAGNVIAKERATITNCWYDGEMCIGDNGGYIGGITGQVENSSHARIMHCLNSGSVTATKEKGSMTMGGIVGVISDERTKVAITDTVNVGVVTTPSKAGIGAFASTILQKTTLTYENCYMTTESCAGSYASKHGTVEGACYKKTTEDLSGYKAYEWTMLDFDKYWAVVKNGTPVLQSFAKEVPSLAKYERQISTDWYKPRDKEYVLNTAKDLYGFYHMTYVTDFEGKTVKLGKDITVNKGNAADWQNTPPKAVWYSIRKFAGTFDGCGKTISGIYMKTDMQGSGLFGETFPQTVIKNFRLTNSYFEGTHKKAAQMGSIAGKGQGTFDSIYSDAYMVADTLIMGGIVGDVSSKEKTVITNCWFDGEMHIGDNGGYIGGILGEVQDASLVEISHCLNTGSIVGTKEKGSLTMGGIIGIIAEEHSKAILSDCLNTGLISVPSKTGMGAMFSTVLPNATVELNNCYATEESCPNSYASKHGTAKGGCIRRKAADLSGYMAYEWTLLDFDKYWTVSLQGTPVLKTFAPSVPGLAGYTRKVNISWYKENQDTYELKTMEDLYGLCHMSYITNFAGKTVKLANDITVNQGSAQDWKNTAPAYPWYAIQSFAGTFDGQGKTIAGIYLKTDIQGRGLFTSTTPTTVLKNFRLENSYFESHCTKPPMLGSVVGKGQGTFDTIYSDAYVVANGLICGGIIGDISSKEKVVVNNCWYDGALELGNNGGYIGGITGEVQDGTKAEIKNCLNTATITGTHPTSAMTMAGIVGVISDEGTIVKIKDCMNTGKVTSPVNSGTAALISTTLQGTKVVLDNCYATTESHSKIVHKVHGTMSGDYYHLGEDLISGFGGYKFTMLDFKNYWAVAENTTPILKSFAKTVPSLEGIVQMSIGWYDENEDEYILSSVEDMYGFSFLSNITDFKGKYIRLDKDVTFVTTESGSNWEPIKTFAGTFDGGMHTIRGVRVEGNSRYTGLFKTATETSVIQNLKIKDSFFTSTKPDVGSVAGTSKGTIKNVYSEAIVTGSNERVGGLVGITSGTVTNIEKCWFNGTATNTSTGSLKGVGGFVGAVYGTTSITDCLNTGTVDASANTQYVPKAGGFVGDVAASANLTFTDCLNTGYVLVKSGKVGGYYVGCYDKSVIKSYTSYGYGNDRVIGYRNASGSTFTVYYLSGGTLTSSTRDAGNYYTVPIMKVSGKSTLGDKAKTTLAGFDFENTWVAVPSGSPVLKIFESEVYDVDWYDASKTEFEIKTLKEFLGFVVLSKENDFAGKTVKIDADITVNDRGTSEDWASKSPQYAWATISDGNTPFAGTFDGGMHTISGLYVNKDTENTGLFSAIAATGTVKNIKLENSFFKSTAKHLGSIAGLNKGKIENVYSDAIVTSNSYCVGGLVGRADGSNVSIKCGWFAGSVTNTATGDERGTGGIVGSAYGTVLLQDCLNEGTVDATASTKYVPKAGGLVGDVAASATLTFTDCLTIGDVLVKSGNVAGYFVGCYDNSQLICNTSYGYGNSRVVGYRNHTSAKFKINYILNGSSGSSDRDGGNYHTNNVTTVSQTSITGSAASTRLEGFDFTNTWATVENGTPVLRVFAK